MYEADHSKANLNEKILFRKISHHLDPEIRTMLVSGMMGNGIQHYISVDSILAIEI